MSIEHARMRVVHKPWGSSDLRPWSEIRYGGAIGELWFQRANMNAPDPALLLKLLFTKEPLSIQVHPDDAFAQSIGLCHGKTEAWYILSATPGAKVAVGLRRRLEAAQLLAAIEDGSISELIQWRGVTKDELIFVPAGTIHAIGPGLVIAEIQQRSEATFRLFDYGRRRELHRDNAVAAANAGPAEPQAGPERLTDSRTLLIFNTHFVVERLALAPRSNWELHAERETWVLVLEGHARIGLVNAFVGEAIYLDADVADIRAGPDGLKALLIYVGPKPIAGILHNLGGKYADPAFQNSSRPPHRATWDRSVRLTAEGP